MFLGLATGDLDPSAWRQCLVYKYYWEWNFSHTPTVLALREDRYKLIQYHGIWDTDELYDLIEDPKETHNLIRDPDHLETVRRMRAELHEQLVAGDANRIPFSFKRGAGATLRNREGTGAAPFPEDIKRDPGGGEP